MSGRAGGALAAWLVLVAAAALPGWSCGATASRLGPGLGGGEGAAGQACERHADCLDGAGPCTHARCDVAQGICVVTPRTDGTACGRDDACWLPGTCRAGACVGEARRPPRCGINNCGTDECGNSCGECLGSWRCHKGSCNPPCDGLTEEGCCDGEVMRYCFEGRAVQALCVNGCGWNPGAGLYECGYTGEAPGGAHPRACPPLPPGGSTRK